MKFANKTAKIIYGIVCIFLTVALVAGIVAIVNFGGRYDSTNHLFNDWNFENNNSGELTTQKLSTSATSIEIIISYGDIEIMPTDKDYPYVTFSANENVEIQTQENNGHCKLTAIMSHNPLNLLNKENVQINFYLPEGKLEELKVKMSAGILKMEDMQADDFSIEMSAGNCVIKESKFKNIDTQINAGNLEIYAASLTKSIKSEVNAGNMKLFLPKDIDGFLVDYNVELGNLSNKSSFDVYKTSHGELSKKGRISYGDSSCKINLKISVGNLKLYDYNED